MALAKISIIKILTNNTGFAASARAAPEPIIPIHKPQARFTKPTVIPDPNIAYPAAQIFAWSSGLRLSPKAFK